MSKNVSRLSKGLFSILISFQCKEAGQDPAGYLLPEDSLEENGMWACDRCPNRAGGFTVAAVMRGLEEELNSLKETNPQKIEDLLKSW